LNVIAPSVAFLVAMLNFIMLIVVKLNTIMLIVVLLNVIKLNAECNHAESCPARCLYAESNYGDVVMLNVFVMNVVAPFYLYFYDAYGDVETY